MYTDFITHIFVIIYGVLPFLFINATKESVKAIVCDYSSIQYYRVTDKLFDIFYHFNLYGFILYLFVGFGFGANIKVKYNTANGLKATFPFLVSIIVPLLFALFFYALELVYVYIIDINLTPLLDKTLNAIMVMVSYGYDISLYSIGIFLLIDLINFLSSKSSSIENNNIINIVLFDIAVNKEH